MAHGFHFHAQYFSYTLKLTFVPLLPIQEVIMEHSGVNKEQIVFYFRFALHSYN